MLPPGRTEPHRPLSGSAARPPARSGRSAQGRLETAGRRRANGRNRAHRSHRTSMRIGGGFTHQRLTILVDSAGRGLVRELGHGGHDPVPGRRSVIVASESEFGSSSSALLECLITVALEHQLRRPPDVDFGYQSGRLMKSSSGPPMTLRNAANAKVRLIVWCKACGHQDEPDSAASCGTTVGRTVA